MKTLSFICLALAVSACSIGPFKPAAPERVLAPEGQLRPSARPSGLSSAPPPAAGARTVEQFDTTTPEERAKAAQKAPSAERSLGTTIASLGDPTKPGFWLETPLVTEPTVGRVVFAATGQASQVDLIPIAGASGAGSRISLAAMRLIGAPLTGLPEITVFAAP